jgi:methylisocitrate lyase
MKDYLDAIQGDRIGEGRTELVAPFADFKNLVGFEMFRELEKEYLPRYVE